MTKRFAPAARPPGETNGPPAGEPTGVGRPPRPEPAREGVAGAGRLAPAAGPGATAGAAPSVRRRRTSSWTAANLPGRSSRVPCMAHMPSSAGEREARVHCLLIGSAAAVPGGERPAPAAARGGASGAVRSAEPAAGR